jgi:hypothetical protein
MSVEITPALLSDLRQKAEAATPGEWLIGYGGMAGDDFAVIISRFWKNEICELNPRSYRRENAEFITTCNPAVVLALVAEVERLRGTQGELAETLSDVLRHTDLSGWHLGEQIEKDATDLLKKIKEVNTADQA